MSEATPDDAWIQAFMSTSPKPLFEQLKRRLQASNTHVTAISELYKQRAAIEAQYADSLAKLAKTAEAGGLNGKQGTEWDQSGGEAKIWNLVVTDLVETSSSHSTLSALLRSDFEQPIRELPGKINEWRRIHDQEAALEKTLKEYEKTATKLDKAASKSKSSKADTLQSEIDQLTRTLSTISPEYYRTYQKLDEERLRGLKEVIVRWGTVRGDIAGKDGERAERTVAGLLSWETDEEVLAVGRRLGGGGPGQNRFPTLSTTHSGGGGTPNRMDRRMSSTPSATSDFSPRPTPRTNGSSSNVTPGAGGGGGTAGFSGLKSMLGRKGTMMGKKDKDGRGRSGSVTASMRSDRDGGFETIGEDDLRSPAGGPGGTGVAAVPPSSLIDDEGFSVPPPDRHRALWEEPSDDLPAPIKSTPAGGASVPPPSTAAATATGGNAGFAQNFSDSPLGSQENLSSTASSMNQAQPKLNLALSQAPIQESEEERQAALAKMQQTLQMQPSGPTRRGTVARGRRDVRNTMFAPGGMALSPGSENAGSPSGTPGISPMPTGGVAGMGLGSAPNQANGGAAPPPIVTRQSSMSSVTSNNPFDSPSISAAPGLSSSVMAPSTDPGLRASMTETINVIMKSGVVSRLQITGEIHLSLRAASSTTSGPIHIRLNAFESLEKIAPNPAYLAQVPDKPGEYFLNSEVLASATSRAATNPAGSKGTLLFKYQVHVHPDKENSLIPLLLEPVFSCKEGETRMILNYKSTSSPLLPVSSLHNVSLIAAFNNTGPAVNNVQTKPAGGIWSPAVRRLTWSLPDLQESGKLIARFTTEQGTGEVMSPQGVQASWAVEGSLVSGLGLEVVPGEIEGDSWRFEEVKKGITTGKYLAEAVINQ